MFMLVLPLLQPRHRRYQLQDARVDVSLVRGSDRRRGGGSEAVPENDINISRTRRRFVFLDGGWCVGNTGAAECLASLLAARLLSFDFDFYNTLFGAKMMMIELLT